MKSPLQRLSGGLLRLLALERCPNECKHNDGRNPD